MDSMEAILKEMASVSNELVDAEKRFDGMKSCREMTTKDMALMNDLMPRAKALQERFEGTVTEEIKKNSTEYGMLVARMLVTDKSFKDLINLRCEKKDFDGLANTARKVFKVPDDEGEDDDDDVQ